MNIQIFGKNKCFDTKKAERFFKERGIKVQKIDILDKGMSKGELSSVISAIGGLDNILDTNAKDKETLNLYKYSPEEMKFDLLLDNQHLLKTPIVRNGKLATIGYEPEVWKKWE